MSERAKRTRDLKRVVELSTSCFCSTVSAAGARADESRDDRAAAAVTLAWLGIGVAVPSSKSGFALSQDGTECSAHELSPPLSSSSSSSAAAN